MIGDKPDILSSKNIIGKRVVNKQNEDLGNVEDVVIDSKEGRIIYVILSFCGILGLGGKYFALPWQALTLDSKNSSFLLLVDQKKLKNAEGFDKNNWPDMANYNWGREVYSHYGFTPYWEANQSY